MSSWNGCFCPYAAAALGLSRQEEGEVDAEAESSVLPIQNARVSVPGLRKLVTQDIADLATYYNADVITCLEAADRGLKLDRLPRLPRLLSQYTNK